MTKLRGTIQTATAEHKPYQYFNQHKYEGPINRSYQALIKFSIAYPDKVSYSVQSAKSLEELKEKYIGAIVTDVKAEYEAQKRRDREYNESKLENYH